MKNLEACKIIWKQTHKIWRNTRLWKSNIRVLFTGRCVCNLLDVQKQRKWEHEERPCLMKTICACSFWARNAAASWQSCCNVVWETLGLSTLEKNTQMIVLFVNSFRQIRFVWFPVFSIRQITPSNFGTMWLSEDIWYWIDSWNWGWLFGRKPSGRSMWTLDDYDM